MGAKATKVKGKHEQKIEKEEKKEEKKNLNALPSTIGIDTQDKNIFPSQKIRKELADVKDEFTPGQKLLIKRYDSSTSFMIWISQIYYEDPFFGALDKLCSSVDEGDQDWYKFISATLQSDADMFLVAFLPSGRIAGFSIIGDDSEDNDSLKRYVTCAGPRGYGIGYALVKEIHAIAKERGKKYVRLSAGTNSAAAYHARQGYVLSGERIPREGPEMIFTLPVNKGGSRKRRVTRRRKSST